eukprot:scaffold29674_cov51-Attheya_sp.AAC.3
MVTLYSKAPPPVPSSVLDEKDTPNKWPFEGCDHRGWRFDQNLRVWRFFDLPNLKVDPNTRQEDFRNGLLASREFDTHGIKNDLYLSINHYKNSLAKPSVTIEDYMLHSFACVNVGLLLFRKDIRNDTEAVIFFQRAADQFDHPTGKLMYGHALVYGIGGIARNISKGIGLLHQAASQGIGEAYFQLGVIHEEGIQEGSGVVKDLSTALSFYEACYETTTLNASLDPNLMWWTPEIFSFRRLFCTDNWNVLVEDHKAVTEHFHQSLVTQAILFISAAIFTRTPQPYHYPPLLVLLPVLGILHASFSFLQNILQHAIRDLNRRRLVFDLIKVKMRAYRKLVDASERVYRGHDIPRGYALRHISLARNQLRRFQIEFWGMKILAGLMNGTKLLVSITLLGTWIVLLISAGQTRNKGHCSNWWKSACEDDLTYLYNE